MCAWLGSEGLREGTRSKGKHLEFKHVNINKQNMIQNLLPTCTWSHELKEPATWRDFFQILHTLWSETDNPVKGVVKMLASYIERVPFHWDKVKKLFSYLLGDRVNESNIDVLLLADTWENISNENILVEMMENISVLRSLKFSEWVRWIWNKTM